MDVADFDFHLPEELIAQEPAGRRDESRLLRLDRNSGVIAHARMAIVASIFDPGDLLVVNNTRVFPARLLGRRDPCGGAVECLLIQRVDDDDRLPGTAESQCWEALVHPGQKLKPGARLIFDGTSPLQAEILAREYFGRRRIRLWTRDRTPVEAAIDAIGHVPLPPYIKRAARDADRDRYQTVYATERGSVAAPTAGLHFTSAGLDSLRQRGIEIAEVTLHVGYGTFKPVRTERVEDHRMDAERYEISEAAAERINAALDEKRRVIAVGTTTTRTLEAVAQAHGGRLRAGAGTTDLFIYPGFSFQVIRGLLTNFHLPRSSLFMLVCAFAGREPVRAAYQAAIDARYRFYSYGDAMLIL
jgi:S-adenosylmethionine:tRNA ribosyltransferase-isomerase